jgi:hypothetical protein
MSKKEFSEFKNCKMSTDDIIKNINIFREDERDDFMKDLYSLLFYTSIEIENKIDLGKIVNAYIGYREGTFVTMTM